MLPVVIIGADDTVSEAFTAWEDAGISVRRFPDAEAAHYALGELEAETHAALVQRAADNETAGSTPAKAALDAMVETEVTKPDTAIERTEQGEWICTVVYGPLVFGRAVTGQVVKLAHSGWTIVADHDINPNPDAPRRVVDGAPEGQDIDATVWQASTKLGAHVVVDMAQPDGLATVLRNLQSRTYP